MRGTVCSRRVLPLSYPLGRREGEVSAKIAGRRIGDKVERHLGPDADDELFAIAMTKICDGFAPECSYHFTCLRDGDCFKSRPDIAAAKVIEAAAEKEVGAVRAHLLAAAHEIRAARIYRGAKVVSHLPNPTAGRVR